jgi:hypothetical protein
VLVPISSTKTRGAGVERLGERHPPGRSLPFVSLQRPHSPFFRLNPIRFKILLKVGSLMLLAAKLSRRRRLCSTVAEGLVRRSSSSSFLVASSAMGGLCRLPSWG